jgi:phosphatidylglycerol---prolipoprotein diacylglyceryl transferase
MLAIAFFFWDPQRDAFTIPWVHLPVMWYGILFAVGVFLGYRIAFKRIQEEYKTKALKIVDRLAIYVVLGMIIGARLGHLLFYEKWSGDPLIFFRFREGGLASHGAALGILIAVFLFYKSYKKEFKLTSYLAVLDWLVIPTACAAVFIRIGNFVNQEVLGVPTQLPWGVIFGHPVDGLSRVPRHPAQLYEALFYLILFLFLWKKRSFFHRPGKMLGFFLMVVFLFRFLIEWVKVEQSPLLGPGFLLTMGQLLSIPLILLGGYLFFKKGKS